MPSQRMPLEIGELPAQHCSAPRTMAERRARYFNTGNAFNVIFPPVPGHTFEKEAAEALSSSTPSGLIPCDISEVLQCQAPATTPFISAQYARIKGGERLTTNFRASGTIGYVICGRGALQSGDENLRWEEGDVFVLPGGQAADFVADLGGDAVLWLVSNEPLLKFEGLSPPANGQAPTELVHYSAAEIEDQISLIDQIGRNEQAAGSALIFSSEQNEGSRNVLPSLTLAMNYLPPGVTQRAHRHNSVAVALIIQGEGCFSTIDGHRKDWSQWSTTITPPTSVHSHSNHGDKRAKFLIVQDGGLYSHARTMGFEFVDTEAGR